MNDPLIRAIIVDDEQQAIDLLVNLLKGIDGVEIVGVTAHPASAADMVIRFHPDILFLDVKMPGLSGFDILNELSRQRYFDTLVVFTTAYDEFALKAFEYSAFDYLMKPIDPTRLQETITRYRTRNLNLYAQRIDKLLSAVKKVSFSTVSGVIFIDPGDVVFIQAEGNYTVFYFWAGRKETVTLNLGNVERMLDSRVFHRADRSTIINLTCLKKVSTSKHTCLFEKNGEELSCVIAREKVNDLIRRMKDEF